MYADAVIGVSIMFSARKDEDKSSLSLPIQPKNCYSKIYENKDVGKLVSLLSSSINSNKKVVFIFYAILSNFSAAVKSFQRHKNTFLF